MKIAGPILFDIDRTLFDTDRFIESTHKSLARLAKTTIGAVRQRKDEYTNNLSDDFLFRTRDYATNLGKAFHIAPEKILHDFLHNSAHYTQALYPDTLSALQALGEKNILGIYSEGEIQFQHNKLHQTGMMRYIHPDYLHIYERKLTDDVVKKLPKGTVVIDDKLTVVEGLASYGVQAIWINRKTKEKHARIPTVFSLSEVVEVLHR
ncbi:MAG TPA: hypothetical protein DCX25_01020 [Candidatus Pacebacteria bacterium]|nr:MAG: hypothetical protein UX00_C0013G0006 [Microgenomates group bacterium GW2011_GWB1_45_17]KKU23553.1 MAG: hypothetical protein UX36_C0004G0006 [Microgenomates group bacterium GW2011_GWC1_46_15]KKU24272.1 MAG: hypothetical protein UX35_C0002G0006 [Microgenomates group bacterium GW2011_GWA1_46_15]HAV14890.1 hypothetical protein [Candidatus Paceibacterota bacterium]HCR11360.1 hypothetical protein [Candidatus Paceibacterota bacterium]